MEFAPSAAKHGIPESDVLHALRNARVFIEQWFEGDRRRLVIGPDEHGGFLEVVVVPADAPTRVIHADRLRRKFYSYLGGRAG